MKFTMSDETTLADLLSLNLHNFEDEVHNIDFNIIEMTIRCTTSWTRPARRWAWRSCCRIFRMSGRNSTLTTRTTRRVIMTLIWYFWNIAWKKLSGYKLMRTSEELIETLEENLVAVQNMMTSKYIAFFFNEVSAWQKTLSTVDLVISRWATRQA